MLVGKLTYDTVKQRQKEKLSPNHAPSEFLSLKNNNSYIERPLKSNSQNSTFKGLSFSGANEKKDDKMKPLIATFGVIAATGLALRFAPRYKKVNTYSIEEFKNFIEEKSKLEPKIIEKHIEHLKNSQYAKNLVKINGDEITLYKKTIPQLIWDGLVYPFKILPADILNGTIKLLGEIKPLKKWAQKTLEKEFFKNIRQRSKIDAQANSLRGLFQKFDELKGKPDDVIASKMFQQSVKTFDPSKGQYDTKHERSLNRIISGLPPAIFLANDAYNLSRMMDDDDKAAKKEQKTRFNQEVARIGFNAYITLITLGALQKYINNSALGIFMMTGITTLVTEAFSRIINGKYIARLTPEKARAENEKNHAPEAQIKPNTSFKASEDNSNNNEKQQKPLLSFDTIMKASALIIAGGFGVKGLRKIPVVEKQWEAFAGFFKKHYRELTEISDYTIEKTNFDKITEILRKNGFKELANKYEKVAETAREGDLIHLGKKDKKIKPFVNFVIAPFKFAWNTVTLPFNLTMKVVKPIQKLFDKGTEKVVKESAEELRKADIESLAKSIENIGKQALKKNFDPKKFETYVSDNIMKAFNADTMSNISNSELSNLAKTAASVATIWFLMTDNYNMVMLKSNGNDVEGAKTKFTERFVQEGSRLFYQTLLIDLFNSTFRSQYNKSLFGMSWITLTNTTIGEWLTRASVGVPIGIHSRDSLLKLEEKQENAIGFKKSYFNFMKRLTGKRSIKSYEIKANESKTIQGDIQPINFTNSNMLNKMIQGN